jgi:hypothetical protein
MRAIWFVGSINIEIGTQNDILQFKAIEFLELRIKQSIISRDVSKRNSRLLSGESGGDSFSYQTLLSHLQTLKLLHSARYPLFFSDNMERVFADRKQHSPSIPFTATRDDLGENPLSTTLIKQILVSFITDYVEYMKEIGLEVILWEDRLKESGTPLTGNRSSVPTFEALKDSSFIPTDVVYMQKNIGKSAIIVQIGISGLYACVNVFTIENPIGEDTEEAGGSDGFSKECEYVRKNIHLFSCKFISTI